MTDPELIIKKLALIETCVRELQTLSRPAEISRDVREERFVEHTLQIAIQEALDIASHIVFLRERLSAFLEPYARKRTRERGKRGRVLLAD